MSFYFIIGFLFSFYSSFSSSGLCTPTKESINADRLAPNSKEESAFQEIEKQVAKLKEERSLFKKANVLLLKENKNLKRELDALRVQKTASCCPCVENKDDVKRKLFTKGSVLTINSKIVHLACSPQMQKSINESRTLLLYSRQKKEPEAQSESSFENGSSKKLIVGNNPSMIIPSKTFFIAYIFSLLAKNNKRKVISAAAVLVVFFSICLKKRIAFFLVR
jgi:hypothetical protein